MTRAAIGKERLIVSGSCSRTCIRGITEIDSTDQYRIIFYLARWRSTCRGEPTGRADPESGICLPQ